MAARLRGYDVRDQAPQSWAVRRLQVPRRTLESRVLGPFEALECYAQLVPESVGAARKHEPLAVGALVELVDGVYPHLVGRLTDPRPHVRAGHHGPGLHRKRATVERCLYLLAQARSLPLAKGGPDGPGGQESRTVAGYREVDVDGRAVPTTLVAVDASMRGDNPLVGRSVCKRPGFPEGGHGAVDEARIHGA